MSAEERNDQAAPVDAAPATAAQPRPRRSRGRDGRAAGRGGQPHGPGFGPPGLIGTGRRPRTSRGPSSGSSGRLRPERSKIVLIILLAVVSVACTVAAPKILARATNLIFCAASSSKQLPAGVTQEQAVAALRAQGQDNLANMLAGMSNINPGQGVDFAAVGRVLLIVTAIYLLSALFGWLQGYLMAGVVARDDLPAAPRRRREARPSAPQVLRQPRAGRHPQPGDERHRQHPADDAADAQPDHHVRS